MLNYVAEVYRTNYFVFEHTLESFLVTQGAFLVNESVNFGRELTKYHYLGKGTNYIWHSPKIRNMKSSKK